MQPTKFNWLFRTHNLYSTCTRSSLEPYVNLTNATSAFMGYRHQNFRSVFSLSNDVQDIANMNHHMKFAADQYQIYNWVYSSMQTQFR